MDILLGIFQALMFFFGIYEEHKDTKELCAELSSQVYVVAPLSDEDYERLKKCNHEAK